MVLKYIQWIHFQGSESSLSSGAARSALQRYPASSLYEITQDVFGAQDMDLQLAKGSIVAVIKEGDPTGNKERYFVDSGGKYSTDCGHQCYFFYVNDKIEGGIIIQKRTQTSWASY